MAIDNQQRFGGMNFDHMPYTSSPQFTNPWTSSSSPSQTHNVYATSHNLSLDNGMKQQPQAQRMSNNVSMGSYASVPITAASAGSPLLVDVYGSQDLLTIPQDLLSPNRSMSTGYGHEAPYTSAPSPVHSAYAPTSSPYDAMGYAQAPVRSTYAIQAQENSRRLSQPSVPSISFDVADDVRMHRQNSLINLMIEDYQMTIREASAMRLMPAEA